MNGGCPVKINEQIITHIVDENHARKFAKFSKEQNTIKKNSKKIMNCPSPDCDELIVIDPTFENRFYTCERRHNFCSVCKTIGFHDESKCSKVK